MEFQASLLGRFKLIPLDGEARVVGTLPEVLSVFLNMPRIARYGSTLRSGYVEGGLLDDETVCFIEQETPSNVTVQELIGGLSSFYDDEFAAYFSGNSQEDQKAAFEQHHHNMQ